MFVLDQSGLQTVASDDQPFEQSETSAAAQEQSPDIEAQQAQHAESPQNEQRRGSYHLVLDDIASVKPCNDPSLPPGYAFWVSLHSRPQGVYFVAKVSEEAEGWVDALHMASYAAKQGRLQMLDKALIVASGEQQNPAQLENGLDLQ